MVRSEVDETMSEHDFFITTPKDNVVFQMPQQEKYVIGYDDGAALVITRRGISVEYRGEHVKWIAGPFDDEAD